MVFQDLFLNSYLFNCEAWRRTKKGPGLTCGRHFVSSGAVCGESVNLRLSHVEFRCVGIRGQRKHAAVQNAVVTVARSVGLSAVSSGYILGATAHG